ncbi:uncharacterized protein METZ01_LOCUS256447 [marine metagenome]|uniref:STI1 domain-containing protein n=2 Tax=marine metagenome TaxID=408172 RepID=A0A382IXF6_9ZZZZ
MKKTIFRSLKTCTSIFLFLWIVSSASHAGVVSQIKLVDGSVIQAEIISFSNGVYKLRSEMLGTLSIAEDRVQSIQPNKSQAPGIPAQSQAADLAVGQKVQGLQQKLISDPTTMDMLLDLQSDPSMSSVLKDKELMRAIQQGNISKVVKNPKIKKLMKSKALGKVIQRGKEK